MDNCGQNDRCKENSVVDVAVCILKPNEHEDPF